MVLFTAAGSDVAALTQATVNGIVSAVDTGALTTAQLVTAVQHVLTAKHIDLCA